MSSRNLVQNASKAGQRAEAGSPGGPTANVQADTSEPDVSGNGGREPLHEGCADEGEGVRSVVMSCVRARIGAEIHILKMKVARQRRWKRRRIWLLVVAIKGEARSLSNDNLSKHLTEVCGSR